MDARDARMTGMWTTGCGGHDGQWGPQHNVTFFTHGHQDLTWTVRACGMQRLHENLRYARANTRPRIMRLEGPA